MGAVAAGSAAADAH